MTKVTTAIAFIVCGKFCQDKAFNHSGEEAGCIFFIMDGHYRLVVLFVRCGVYFVGCGVYVWSSVYFNVIIS